MIGDVRQRVGDVQVGGSADLAHQVLREAGHPGGADAEAVEYDDGPRLGEAVIGGRAVLVRHTVHPTLLEPQLGEELVAHLPPRPGDDVQY